MIKLDLSMYDGIKDDYFNKIVQEITDKAKPFSNQKFFNHILVDEFFKIDDKFNKEKLRKIIFMDFINIDKNDEILKNYFLTGCLIHFSRFTIMHELEKRGLNKIKKEKYDFRKRYVEKYRNPWIEHYITKYGDFFQTDKRFHAFINDVKKEFTKLNSVISKVIKYKLLESELRNKIITSSGISVCPYCDRQYITYFEGDKFNYTTADLDHFYPKSVFVLFALSLYNFIPSCKVCNQRFKIDRSFNILYPFKAGFGDDAKFTIDVNDIDSLYGKGDSYGLSINIDNTSENKQKILNNIEMFHLESVYQHHKSYIKELLIKRNLIYTDAYLDLMQQTFSNLNLTNEDLEKFLYGYDFENDKRDKTLGKLTKDILEK